MSSSGSYRRSPSTAGFHTNRDESDSANSLCQRCSELELSRDKFIVRNQDTKPGLERYDPAGLQATQLGLLDEIYQRTECPLCRLIFRATSSQDGQGLGTVGYDGLTIKGERVSCFLEWQLDGREARDEDLPSHPWKAKTRRIRVFSKVAAFPDAHIVLTEKASQRDPSFFGQRIHSAEVDIDLLRRWMKLCENYHGASCHDPQTRPVEGQNLRLIDVHRMCLVEESTNCRYVALSYVWGRATVETQTLRRKSYLSSYMEGAFEYLPLDQTIRAAIGLCRVLHVRYLWVDRLCIVQDSDEDKVHLIRNMDSIFGNSVLTICAASGSDSNAGLPGFCPKERKIDQYIERIADMDLMALWTPEEHIQKSFWNTRAWIFQERILTRRAMIFTSNRVFFQCRQSTWTEEINANGKLLSWNLDRINAPLSLMQENPLRHYSNCVKLYTVRSLTYSGDKLNAFEGITASLEEHLGSKFFCGLPTALFDWALLWEPSEPLYRISSTDPYFPSWAWCGWVGGVEWRSSTTSGCLLNLHEWLINHTWIIWRTGIAENDGSDLVWNASREVQCRTSRSVRGRWLGYSLESTADDCDEYGRAPRQLGTGIKTLPSGSRTVLSFSTHTAFFTLSRKNMSSGAFASKLHPGLHRLGILDNNGDWCGTIVLDDSWLTKIGKPLEFIAISEARDFSLEEYDSWTYYLPKEREQSEWDVYFALLVERGEGKWFFRRVGLAKIFKSAFHGSSVEPGYSWKHIMLG